MDGARFTMKIGIIGAGQIGGTLTRLFRAAGHEVAVANSREPETLADLVAETGAKAVTPHEAARAGQVVIVTIQQGRVPELPKELFESVPQDVVIVDTGNYYPRERDGRIEGIEKGMLESRCGLWIRAASAIRSIKTSAAPIRYVALYSKDRRSRLLHGNQTGAKALMA
jgi:predicted dinucleotide-utilizing enzyme